MQLLIGPDGRCQCVYDETIDLQAIGQLSIRRASNVEPDDLGQWWADLLPVTGPRLGPFLKRSLALAAEREWLCSQWPQIGNPPDPERKVNHSV